MGHDDGLRRYEPTPRRLAKLRARGIWPLSELLVAAVYWVVVTCLGIIAVPPVVRLLADMLARDLQGIALAADETWEPAGWFAGRLVVWAVAVIAAGMAILAGGWLVRRIFTGGQAGEEQSPEIPSHVAPGLRDCTTAKTVLDLLFFLLGIGAVPAVVYLAWQYRPPGPEHGVGGFVISGWVLWLSVMCVLGGAHMLLLRGIWLLRARMTYREVIEENRQTEGHPLTLQRRRQRLRRISR